MEESGWQAREQSLEGPTSAHHSRQLRHNKVKPTALRALRGGNTVQATKEACTEHSVAARTVTTQG